MISIIHFQSPTTFFYSLFSIIELTHQKHTLSEKQSNTQNQKKKQLKITAIRNCALNIIFPSDPAEN